MKLGDGGGYAEIARVDGLLLLKGRDGLGLRHQEPVSMPEFEYTSWSVNFFQGHSRVPNERMLPDMDTLPITPCDPSHTSALREKKCTILYAQTFGKNPVKIFNYKYYQHCLENIMEQS